MREPMKIAKLPFTGINHGLERLDHLGIHASMWDRMRLDDEFGGKAAELIKDLYVKDPGRRCVVKLDRMFLRAEMIDLIRGYRRTVSRDVKRLPAAVAPWSNQVQLAVDNPVEFEYFVVNPYRFWNQQEAWAELEFRNLIPATADDGLAFYLNYVSTIATGSLRRAIVAMGSPGDKCFLVMGEGLTVDDRIREFYETEFLAKRPIPVPSVSVEE